MKVKNNTKIYIFCPPNLTSGGQDALHQLSYYLCTNGYDAYIVYYLSENTKCPQRFEKYGPKVISYKDIVDCNDNIVIVPEADTWILRRYKNMRKCIWWLSYNYYDGLRHKKMSQRIKNILKFVLNCFKGKNSKKYEYYTPIKHITDNIYNFCGSKYAFDQIKGNGLTNVEMLVEPLSLEFISNGMADNLTAAERSDIIPYNPAKPSEIMEKLLKRKDLSFVPIKGMELSQIIELFRHSKLYIDFGEFGGPERLPKESVFNGTCLLIGRRNAAVNDFDVAIPEEFKISDYNNEEYVVSRIKDILNNYDSYISQFQGFREKINLLENNFIKSIQQIFVKE